MQAATEEKVETIVEPASTGIAEYDPIAAEAQKLRDKYAGRVWTFESKADETECRQFIRMCVTGRTETERVRKGLKSGHLEQGRKIDSIAKNVTAVWEELESPARAALEAFEARKEAEKQRKLAAEKERVDAIKLRLAKLNDYTRQALRITKSTDIDALITQVEQFEIGESFAEFAGEAVALKTNVLSHLADRLTSLKEDERRKAELAKQAEDLRLQREDQTKLDQRRATIQTLAGASTIAAIDEAMEQLDEIVITDLSPESQGALTRAIDIAIRALCDRRAQLESDTKRFDQVFDAVKTEMASSQSTVPVVETKQAAPEPQSIQAATPEPEEERPGVFDEFFEGIPAENGQASLSQPIFGSVASGEIVTFADEDEPIIPSALWMIWAVPKPGVEGSFIGSADRPGESLLVFLTEQAAAAAAEELYSHGVDCRSVRVK